ncbi:MAG: hypothetical protein Kow0013_15980 [Pararhodobacter sp.]
MTEGLFAAWGKSARRSALGCARRNPTGEEGVVVIHARAYTAAEAQRIADYLSTVCTGGSCGGKDEPPAPEPVQAARHIDRMRHGDVSSDVAPRACAGRCTEIRRSATRIRGSR